MAELTFPFGCPILARQPTNTSPAHLFVLGAYPSALHVQWKPPGKWRLIRALAVDNEPEPFWNGEDASHRIEKWKSDVRFRPEWGQIRGVGGLNGSSGCWVDRNVLQPLGIKRADACITDCLDLYHASTGVMARVKDTYAPFATHVGLPEAHAPSHPSEDTIVSGAIGGHLPRLRAELDAAKPKLVVTLGNAALRVFAAVVTVIAESGPGDRLSAAAEVYGQPWEVRLPNGAITTWFPIAHPAAPQVYQHAHERWVAEHHG